MVVEATGQHKYADKGNMTKAEIDLTMKIMTEAKKAGQFRAFWKDFNECVNLMASGETVIQSMWSPAVTKVRSMGIACTFQPLKEGYRSWASGFCVSKAVSGPKLDWAYEFVNWYPVGLGRRLSQSPGLLFGRPLHRQGQHDGRRMGLLDGRQGRPSATSRRPTAPFSRRPAPSVTAGPTRTAWAASPAGTPSWTRTITWCASGMNSSPLDDIQD